LAGQWRLGEELAERLPLPTPAPVRVGEPSSLFGHTWTIVRWVEGDPADRAPITRIEAAEILAGFLRALHDTDAEAAREVWEKAVAASAWDGALPWLHGDLHPANVVVRDGMLAGVIDFGEMCSGDPATDLAAAWVLLPAGAASRFCDAYEQADEPTITRARGWVLAAS
jgi:aminoglycoside phosphotransferase (APT) family kinase protein